jgi:hypothetical protein
MQKNNLQPIIMFRTPSCPKWVISYGNLPAAQSKFHPSPVRIEVLAKGRSSKSSRNLPLHVEAVKKAVRT